MAKNEPVAVLADLTALFSCRTKYRKHIDYQKLDNTLKNIFNVKEFAQATSFTLYHKGNAKQQDFIQFLKTTLNWEVETVQPNEIRRGDYLDYRFDVPIAYELGSLVQQDDIQRVVVISDSYELLRPMHDAAQYLDSVSLAFFSEALDPRWHKVVHDSSSDIKLIDFDIELRRNREPEEEYSRYEE